MIKQNKNIATLLAEKIENRSAQAAVIGLGYVGLPLAVEIAHVGFPTTGIDVTVEKVRSIQSGESYVTDVKSSLVFSLVQGKKLNATSDFSILAKQDCISVCVPTPLSKGKNPDMSFILEATTKVAQYLRKGQLIILESTTYPGTTDEVVLPILEKTGLKVGEDFFLSFSPERIDPGNKHFGLRNTPKVVGGVTSQCTALAQLFYGKFVDRVVPVGSSRAAEMVKLLENTFRAVNIGLANEIAIICQRLGIDTWEVIEAAASKPFGFMPFYPGPGLGGHCIPVDPHYLLWKMRALDYNARFIQLADEINSSMPRLVVEKISDALNENKKSIKGSRILILGVAYKGDIDDCRESPSLDVIHLLLERGAIIRYSDPNIPKVKICNEEMYSVSCTEGVNEYDCVVLLTRHSSFDIKKIVESSQLFIDTRNGSKGLQGYEKKIRKL